MSDASAIGTERPTVSSSSVSSEASASASQRSTPRRPDRGEVSGKC